MKVSLSPILRSKLFYQYFLSYSLVLLLPLLTLGYFSYTHVANQLQKQIESSMASEVANIEQRADALQTSIIAISNQVGQSAIFSRHTFTANEYNMMIGIDMLANFKVNNPDMFDILLYYRGDDRLYSAKGVSSLRVVGSSIYQYGNWTPEEMKSDLNEVAATTVRPAESVLVNSNERVDMVTIMMPLGSPGYPYGTIVFLVREPDLFRVSQDWIRFHQASIYLLNQQGSMIAASNPDAGSRPLDPAAVRPAIVGTSTWSGKLNGQVYTFIQTGSSLGQWSVLSVFSNHVVLAEIDLYRHLLERILIGLLAVGVMSALALAFIQYRPIRKIAESMIAQTLQRMRPNRSSDHRGNELVWIRRSVDRMIEDQEELAKEEWIERLLRGEAAADKIDDGVIRRIAGNRELTACFVVLVRCEAGEPLNGLHRKKRLIRQRLHAAEAGEWTAALVDLVDIAKFAVLVCLHAGDAAAARMEALGVLKREIELAELAAFTMSCGKIVRGLDQANRSFIEALTAMENRVKYGANSVILYEDIDDAGAKHAWYSPDELMKYLQCLKQGDGEVAVETLVVLIDEIRRRERSLLILKSKCFELISSIYRTAQELNLPEYAKRLEKTLAFETLQELEAQLLPITRDICRSVREVRESGNQVLMSDIEAYLHEHFNSPMLSLESIADHFSLSPTYMSRLIKEKSGKSFTDWLTKLKLDHAKYLLTHSDATIREISERSGYVDYPNFMRRFKKIEGMTPGEYRKIHHSNSEQRG